jgi:Flp pilus assembly protein TadG
MKKTELIKSKKGSSMVLFAAALTMLLGFASISVDIGLLAAEKASLANAADAAALAGAQQLLINSDQAVDTARQYFQKNGQDPENAFIQISEDKRSVTIQASKKADFIFAGVLGFKEATVSAFSEARIMPVTSVPSGIRPFAVENQVLNFGQQYTLKYGGGGGSGGNFGALALGGSGASRYKNNIINGYTGNIMIGDSIKVGDWVETEPGNMSGPTKVGIEALISQCHHYPRCTFDSYEPDCPKIIIVVIADSLDVEGRSEVRVEGFAAFFLEGVEGHGNESIVTGRFIRMASQGEVSESQADFGLHGIKLVK